MSKRIYLNISEIASYIGENKWDYITPFENLWKRSDPDYAQCLNNLKNKIVKKNLDLNIVEIEKSNIDTSLSLKKITQRQHTILTNQVNLKQNEIVKEINVVNKNIEDISLNQTQKIEKKIGKEIIQKIQSKETSTNDKRIETNKIIEKLNINKEEKKELLLNTESLINKTHGIIKEDSAITLFEKKYNIKLNTDQKYYSKKINDRNYFIGGKLDGITEHYIVEVKNRTKAFFSSVRDYELIQIQLYMYITQIYQAKLVEKFNNKIKVTDISYQEQYVNDTLKYLNVFILKFEEFLLNQDLKMEYISLNEDEKKIFLNKLYLNNIKKLKQETFAEIALNTVCLIDDLN
jgi:hypothetical protein